MAEMPLPVLRTFSIRRIPLQRQLKPAQIISLAVWPQLLPLQGEIVIVRRVRRPDNRIASEGVRRASGAAEKAAPVGPPPASAVPVQAFANRRKLLIATQTGAGAPILHGAPDELAQSRCPAHDDQKKDVTRLRRGVPILVNEVRCAPLSLVGRLSRYGHGSWGGCSRERCYTSRNRARPD